MRPTHPLALLNGCLHGANLLHGRRCHDTHRCCTQHFPAVGPARRAGRGTGSRRLHRRPGTGGSGRGAARPPAHSWKTERRWCGATLDSHIGALEVNRGRLDHAVFRLAHGAECPVDAPAQREALADCAGQLALIEAFRGNLELATRHGDVAGANLGLTDPTGIGGEHALLARAWVHLERTNERRGTPADRESAPHASRDSRTLAGDHSPDRRGQAADRGRPSRCCPSRPGGMGSGVELGR